MGDSPISILERYLTQPVTPENTYWVRSRDFWGTFARDEDLRAARDKCAAHYRAIVAEISLIWGEPDFSGNWDTAGFPRWCPASELSYWRKGGRLACVWWEHQDNDVPCGLVLKVAADTESGV